MCPFGTKKDVITAKDFKFLLPLLNLLVESISSQCSMKRKKWLLCYIFIHFCGNNEAWGVFCQTKQRHVIRPKITTFCQIKPIHCNFLQMTALQYYTCQFIWAFASHSHKQEICNLNCHRIMELYCFIAFYFHYWISIFLMRGFTN